MKIIDLIKNRTTLLAFWIALIAALIQFGRMFVIVGLVLFPDLNTSAPPEVGFELTPNSLIFAFVLLFFSFLSFHSLFRHDFSAKKGSLFSILYALLGIGFSNILYGPFALAAVFEIFMLGIAAPVSALFVIFGEEDPAKYLHISFWIGVVIIAMFLFFATTISKRSLKIGVRCIQVLLLFFILGVVGCVKSGDYSF